MITDIRDYFFDELYENATHDKDLIFITSDMGAFSLEKFKKELPDQFINVGISEQNAINVAAGLALSGKKPFVYSIIPFVTLRCCEQIKINMGCMNLPIKIIGVGPGLAYDCDGATHHAIEDIAIMSVFPNIYIYNPSDFLSSKNLAQLCCHNESPTYVRIDKGNYPIIHKEDHNFDDGMSVLKDVPDSDVLIIVTGTIAHNVLEIYETLLKKNIKAKILDIYRIKPINNKLLMRIATGAKRIITVEEHFVCGGLGDCVARSLGNNIIHKIGMHNNYINLSGSRSWIKEQYGLDNKNIIKKIENCLKG